MPADTVTAVSTYEDEPVRTEPAAVPPSARQPVLRPRPPRRPKFRAFLLTGAVVGLLVALVVDQAGPNVPNYGTGSVIGFIGLLFAGVGALLGGILAVLLDRR